MPGKLKVRVVAGRGLPIMDRATDLTDAFVEVKFGSDYFKTEVYKKSLNPQWNSEWFVFEVEDEALQDEPLELRVLDYDTYSAHDSIGKIYLDLNPLLSKDNPIVIIGWFPIYDTMHGIRGELNVIVKVDLFSDFSRFRQSSCGIQFFCTSEVPSGHRLQYMHGFVEELVVNDDPEYQWIDKIRTPRASNEARQRLFSKLSGSLQRKIGLKVLEMGGNAVIGYCQNFDLEGESGIVVRGIGTAVTLTRTSLHPASSPLGASPMMKDSPVPEDTIAPSSPPSQVGRNSTSPVRVTFPQNINRRMSDSDISTTTPPKGGSLGGSSNSGSATGSGSRSNTRLCLQQPSIDMMEYPFFTLTSFPVGFIAHLGGVVAARSVRLLGKIHNPEEPETRDAWWTEIRTEIRSHCRAMGCHAVIGYSEQTTICDEIIILSAMGTAARVNMNLEHMALLSRLRSHAVAVPLDRQSAEREREKDKDKEKHLFVDVNLANQASQHRITTPFDTSIDDSLPHYNCTVCHVPYKASGAPFPVILSPCAICRRKKVPDVLFTTLDPPPEIQIHGKASLIQARICRSKSKSKGEGSAKEISDSLPFVEYELHNQLMHKLKIRGMNGLLGLKIQISVGETLLIGVATATAVYFAALPPPPIPKVTGQVATEEESIKLTDLQKKIVEKMQQNREIYKLPALESGLDTSPGSIVTDDSDDEISELELSTGNKDAFVLEVDDMNDETTLSMLKDWMLPEGFNICNTHSLPGTASLLYNLQMFTKVWRVEDGSNLTSKSDFGKVVENIFKKICFKLRKMTPCCLCKLDFSVDLPDEDEVQISVTGVCIALEEDQDISSTFTDLTLVSKGLLKTVSTTGSGASGEQDDMMFHMEEEMVDSGTGAQPGIKGKTSQTLFPQCRLNIELTPLPYVPTCKIERYLGNYNFFFIRETTSLKEIGGVGGFMQCFLAEVLAIVRSSVAALGGNALVAYTMNQCVLFSNPNKNQCQCLIHVIGDAVSLTYDEVQTYVPDPIRKPGDSSATSSTSQ
ncbi:hypothetical protein ScPMuIL_015641 [Solemya velum]